MKLSLKDITLKDDTLKEIEECGINADISNFINSYSNTFTSITALTNNKIESLESEDLYQKLSKVYNIELDSSDYYKVLSEVYGKHYSGVINVYTNMRNSNNELVSLKLLVSSKVRISNGSRLSVKELRKITSNYDAIVLEEDTYTDSNIKNFENYENFSFVDVDIKDKEIQEDSPIATYFYDLIKNSILPKNILNDLKKYYDELEYQKRCIFKLDESEDKEIKKLIVLYKKEYDRFRSSDKGKGIEKKKNRKY